MVAAGLRDVVRRYRLRRITRELAEAAEYSAQLRPDQPRDFPRTALRAVAMAASSNPFVLKSYCSD
jgi:hypothetical protein